MEVVEEEEEDNGDEENELLEPSKREPFSFLAPVTTWVIVIWRASEPGNIVREGERGREGGRKGGKKGRRREDLKGVAFYDTFALALTVKPKAL